MTAAVNLTITQHRSAVGSRVGQRETLRSLGLGKIGRTTTRVDSPQLRGMIRVVDHLVKVEASGPTKGSRRAGSSKETERENGERVS